MNDLPLELLKEISNVVKGDFITFTSTCKTLNTFNTVSERAKRSNHLLTLMKHNPDTKWSYYELSRNPGITWDIVIANPDTKWSYYELSRNKFNKD